MKYTHTLSILDWISSTLFYMYLYSWTLYTLYALWAHKFLTYLLASIINILKSFFSDIIQSFKKKKVTWSSGNTVQRVLTVNKRFAIFGSDYIYWPIRWEVKGRVGTSDVSFSRIFEFHWLIFFIVKITIFYWLVFLNRALWPTRV